MPTKGINFSSTKHKANSSVFSSNPRTAATRKWEHELGGLSLALHRVNKAATVARGRAIAKVKSSSMYAEANEDIREKLLKEAIDEVNRKRDLKRAEAQREWIELYGEEDHQDKNDEMKQVNEEKEDGDEGEDDKYSSISESIDGDEDANDGLEEGYDEEEDEDEDEEDDYSQAEEDDGDGDEEVVELSQEQQEALTNRLLELRAYQAHEQEAFIARLEARANARGALETPDDYVFGGDK